ncbi:MAG: hypothetical protein LBV06_01460 [Propionibacteriaceae bacterium]|jgi:hypothetical protein|nr:hypothetical protein [Propionibacteriaceae bacterium]
MRRLTRYGSVLVSVAGLVAASAGTAKGDGLVANDVLLATESSNSSEIGVFVYAESSSLPGSVVQLNQGERTDTGCSFEVNATKAATDDTVEVIRELSFDPRSCTQRLARATYPAGELPGDVRALMASDEADGMVSDSSEALNYSAPGNLGGGKPRHGVFHYSATYKALTKDPVGWITTSTQATLEWKVSMGLVQSYSASGDWSWLAASGWVRSAKDTWGGWGSGTPFADTTARYSNFPFCA